MKRFLIIALSLLFVCAAEAQKKPVYLRNTDNTLFDYGRTSLVTTTDSTLTALDSIVVASNEAGIIEVQVVGFNDSTKTAVTGSQIVRYVKNAGTLTLGTPTDVLAKSTDGPLGTSTWSVTTSGNNIIVQVKGKAGFSIRWQANVRRIYRKTT